MPVQHFQEGSGQEGVTAAAGPSFSAADQVVYDAFLAEIRRGGTGDLSGLSDEGLALLTSAQEPPGLIQYAKDFAGQAVEAVTSAPGAAADWLTGANVEFPELGGGNLVGASPADIAKYQTLIATTLDDYKLEAGIKNIFPEAKTTYDKFGNLLVTLEDVD